MIEDEGVRPEGCICELCSDIQRYMTLPALEGGFLMGVKETKQDGDVTL